MSEWTQVAGPSIVASGGIWNHAIGFGHGGFGHMSFGHAASGEGDLENT